MLRVLLPGMVDCFRQGVAAEGPRFLYRGVAPAFAKLAPYTTISFLLTETITDLATGRRAF